MPSKLGMGGEGQEQYNPNDGKYVEDGIPNKSEFTKKNNLGNDLTPQQEEYFKDSKIRDENGNLMVLYHGTPNGTFDVFNPGNFIFLTNSESVGMSYTNNRDEKHLGNNPNLIKLYANIKNPFIINANGNNWNGIIFNKDNNSQAMKSYHENYIEFVNNVSDFFSENEFYVNFDEIKEIFEYFGTFETSIGQKKYVNYDDSNIIIKLPFLGEKIHLKKNNDGYINSNEVQNALIELKEAKKEIMSLYTLSTDEIVRHIYNNGNANYDGIIINNVVDYGSGNEIEPSNVYIAFDSNQVKNITNQNPTNSNSISDGQTQTNNTKQQQLEIIQKHNPAPNDINTWIRDVNDIKTLGETLEDSDYADYEEYNPDWTKSMAQEAINSGYVTVYSSYPIEQGIFVSPSRMEAQSYAGNGRVYSKKVPVNSIAWIDPTQGQYANIEEAEAMKYFNTGDE